MPPKDRPEFRGMNDRRKTVYLSPRMKVEFKLHRSWVRRMATSQRLEQLSMSVVRDRALPYARAISPRSNRDHDHYQDSFHTERTHVTIAGLRRVGARLWNLSDHAAKVEWINGSRVLGKTLAHLNHASILFHQNRTLRHGAKPVPFVPERHPRGARGRFVPRNK